jgi:hypothetical protein
VNGEVSDLFRRDPAGFLAWVNARWGVFGIRWLDDPGLAEVFWVEGIRADPRLSPEYHWQRMFGCALGIAASLVPVLLAGALVGLLALGGSAWMVTIVPGVGFMLLMSWHGVMHWLANGRAERLPVGLMRSSWRSMLVSMLLSAGVVAVAVLA